MQLLFVFLFLLSLASFVGWVWLVTVGFRESTVWGICLLLFPPISVVIFAIKYWDDAKKPFLIYAGSSMAGLMIALVGVPLMVGQAAAEMSAEFDEAMERHQEEMGAVGQPATAIDDGAVALAHTGAAEPDAPDPAETLAAILREEAAPPTPVNDGYDYLPDPAPTGFRSIRVRDASRFMGDYVRFVDTGGGEHSGRLKRIEGELIVFERHLTAGTFTFEYRRNEIRNLYVAY